MSHTFVLCFFLPLSNLYFIGLRMNFLNGGIMIEMVPDITQKLILEKKKIKLISLHQFPASPMCIILSTIHHYSFPCLQ